jgi:NAD(P)-dependent dehydrogenase (short-subunit alcohol dehydrogenase family)
MNKSTIIVCGHGPGVSDAVARRFGREGHSVAIAARNAGRLSEAVKALADQGIKAQAFPCDLGNLESVRKLVRDARSALGPIGIVHWNAYAMGAGDLTTAKLDELRSILDVSLFGLIAAVQEGLADLKAQKGSVLVTGGGLGLHDPRVDAMAVQWGAMGLAIGKAAQQKTVGLLHQRLKGEGVYVGQVTILGTVKGTAWDSGNATLEGASIADKFWDLHTARSEMLADVRG